MPAIASRYKQCENPVYIFYLLQLTPVGTYLLTVVMHPFALLLSAASAGKNVLWLPLGDSITWGGSGHPILVRLLALTAVLEIQLAAPMFEAEQHLH